MIRGAIFDIDGTLLDSMPIWHDLGSRFLAARGITAGEELSGILFPMSLGEGVSYLKRKYGLPDTEEAIEKGILSTISDFYRNEVQLKPGAADFLAFLSGKGVPMIIATGGNRELADAALTRLGIRSFFREILTCPPESGKSDPAVFLEAASILGTIPAETLVFEDTIQAIETAQGAGFIPIAVRDTESAAQEQAIRAMAVLTVDDFLDPELQHFIS